MKVIVNLIGKAITAPFSLLASAIGGGGQDLSSVSFAPGSARLNAAATDALDKVAKVLADRPALRLTVVGSSRIEAERDGYQREVLDEQVRAEKRRAVVKAGGSAAASIAAAQNISAAEYPALLKEIYARADIAKPRNLIGMAKDLPQADMEKLLLADIKVSEEAMRALAVQRGVVVKDYLQTKNLPAERLFLGADKASATEPDWTPRAELNLSVP